jgi:hypothetical protein
MDTASRQNGSVKIVTLIEKMPDPDVVARLYGVKREIEDLIDELDDTDAPAPEPADGPKLAVVVGQPKCIEPVVREVLPFIDDDRIETQFRFCRILL